MSITERIRARGGEVIRDGWRLQIRRGRLNDEAMAWVREHRAQIMRETWGEYDDWEERAAIMEYDGGLPRDAANDAAYRRVMQC